MNYTEMTVKELKAHCNTSKMYFGFSRYTKKADIIDYMTKCDAQQEDCLAVAKKAVQARDENTVGTYDEELSLALETECAQAKAFDEAIAVETIDAPTETLTQQCRKARKERANEEVTESVEEYIHDSIALKHFSKMSRQELLFQAHQLDIPNPSALTQKELIDTCCLSIVGMFASKKVPKTQS